MKKNSSKRRPAAEETVGIDLGDHFSHYAVLNAEGEFIEEGKFRNEAASIRRHFGGPPARVAMEVGAQSAWMAREMEQLGHEVIVADARQLKWITASGNKNDPADARKLARLAQSDLGLLAPVEQRSEQQAELAVIRARDALVRARTLLVNAARGLAKGIGHRLPKTLTRTFGQRALECLPDELWPALQPLLDQIDRISTSILEYDRRIGEIAVRHAEVGRLKSVPGVGTLTALAFTLTLGRAQRFTHSRDVGCYLGLRPKRRQSGRSDPELGISRTGDGYVRRLLVQSAHYVLGPFGPDSALRQWGLAKCGTSGANKRAIVAVARKLSVLLHHLWVSGERFQAFPLKAKTEGE
jgi:transposase